MIVSNLGKQKYFWSLMMLRTMPTDPTVMMITPSTTKAESSSDFILVSFELHMFSLTGIDKSVMESFSDCISALNLANFLLNEILECNHWIQFLRVILSLFLFSLPIFFDNFEINILTLETVVSVLVSGQQISTKWWTYL